MARAVTRDEAEALMHEVFVRLLRQGHTFREGTQRFEAWLWTIVRNLLIDTVIQEIAATCGRTPGATRQYLSECRLKLKPFVERCREHLQP